MHILEPRFQGFLGEALGPPNKRWAPPLCGPDEITAHLFIGIVLHLLEVILPQLPIFGRTLWEVKDNSEMTFFLFVF